MKNILSVGIFYSALLCSSYSSSSFAGVVDFSQCGANSSFAIVTQSEGPTYACGGLDTGVGNPINVLNGNKFEAVEDFKELPSFKGLSFSRFYNSQSHANTPFGYGWYSSFDLKLYEQPDIIQIRLESGKRINFKKNRINLGNNQFVIRALPLNPSDGWIEKKIDGSGWVWHKTQSNQDYFFQYLGGKDPHLAHITKITALADIEKNDPTLNFSFAYDQQQRLVSVKNGQGQQLNFAYSITKFGLPQIVLTTPLGQYFYFLDRNNNLAQVVYPDGRRFKYSYDPKFQGGDIHNLTAKSIFDRTTKKFKLLSQWQYDNQDRAFLSQHAGGVEKVTIQFDVRTRQDMPANYAATKSVFKNIVTNSLGQKTAYSYQIEGTQFQLLESLGAGCASCGTVNKRYRFNAQGLVVYAADLDLSGKAIRAIDLKYNDLGEVLSKTVSGIGVQAQTTFYEYESYQLKSSNVSNLGNPLLVQLNQRDVRRLKTEFRNSVVAGKQYRKSYAYDQDNRLISVKESGFSPLGDTLVRESKYGYDQHGRLAWEDGPLPNGKSNSPKDSDITQYVYTSDQSDLIARIIYPENLQAQFKYDTQGRLVKYVGVDQIEAQLSYNSQGEVSEFKYASVVTQLDYTQTGKLQQILNQTGQKMNFTYDDVDQLASLYDGQNNQIKFVKNTENQVSKAQLLNPNGTLVQEKNYDLTSQQSADPVLNALSSTPHNINDAVDNIARPNLLGISAFKLQSILHTPMQLDWSTPIQAQNSDLDIQNKTTSYFYNDFGEIVKVQSPVTGITTYQYNTLGLIIGQKKQDGRSSLYQRDNAQRVIGIKSYNIQKQLDESGQIIWGKLNKPTLIKFKAGEERFEYNANGQLTKHVLLVDGKQFDVRYKFNQDNQLIGRTLPDQHQLTYNYRNKDHARAGLLESIQLKGGVFGLLSETVIDGLNRDTDTSVNYGYRFGNGLEHREVLDKQGRMITSGNVNTGETSLDYLDDQSNEPTKVSYRNKTYLGTNAPKQFNPSLTNQTLSLFNHSPSASVKAIPVNASDNLNYKDYLKTTQYGAEYDQFGRKLWTLEGDRVLFFSYDSADRLTKIEYLQQHNNIEQVIDYFTEDAHVKKSTLAEYKYNLFGQRIKKSVTTAGSKTAKTTYYFYDGSQLVAEADAEGKVEKSYVWMNQIPVAMIDHDELFYIHVDHRQAPIAVTNTQRKVVWQAELSDYLYASPLAYNHGRLGTIEFNLRGSNQYFDEESNLHYNTNRYFDAKNERYITPDPLGLAVGPDLYAFGLGQPHSMNDPLGLAPTPKTPFDKATFNQKIAYLFTYAAKMLPASLVEVGNELKNLVNGTTLAVIGGVLGVWAALHVVGIGFVADAVIAAASIFMYGLAIYDLIMGFGKALYGLMTATCWADLDVVGKALSKAFATGLIDFAGGKVLGLGAKFGNIFNKMLDWANDYSKKFNLQTINRYKQLAEEFVQTRIKGNRIKNLCDCCFVSGTLVWAERGYIPIEELDIGDKVYSLPENSKGIGKPELKEITRTIITQPKPTYKVSYKDLKGHSDSIEASDNHPFYIVDKGWLDTVELKKGMKLLDDHRKKFTITKVEPVSNLVTTFNLTVLDNHTFFVSPNKIWVHNAGKNCSCNTTPTPKTSTNPDDILSDIGKNKPVPLTSREIKKVTEWAEVRIKYIQNIKNQDLSKITDTQVKNLIERADRSIMKNMTPDDLAAVIKEKRGVKIPDPRTPGRYYDHIGEFEQAAQSIKNAIGNKDRGIIAALDKLKSQGKANSYEYSLLQSKLKDLSSLLDYYEKKLYRM